MRPTHEEREQATDEVMAALGETRCRKSEPWWMIYFVLTKLGRPAVDALVARAREVHATSEMRTADGSRARTLGGCFFRLVREKLGMRWFSLVREAEKAWGWRWLRKIDLAGPRPATPEGLEAALRALGEDPSARGLRIFLEMAAAPPKLPRPRAPRAEDTDPVAAVVERRGIALNACQTDARTPAAREALAAIVDAAAQHMAEMPEEAFRPRPVAGWKGTGPGRKPASMPVVEVRPRRRPG